MQCYICNKITKTKQSMLLHKKSHNEKMCMKHQYKYFDRCTLCRREQNRKLYDINSQKLKERTTEQYNRLKYKVLDAYGRRCACCGETKESFLTIEHKKGNGKKHKKEVGSGRSFYKWLRDNNYPIDFEILCFNCNTASYIFGKCPHKGWDERLLSDIITCIVCNKELLSRHKLTAHIKSNHKNFMSCYECGINQQKNKRRVCNKCSKLSTWRYTKRLRKEVITAYGGKCICCNIKDWKFLTLDHPLNNGKEHRKIYTPSGAGRLFYKALKDKGFPKDGLVVLCHSCNFSHYWYGPCKLELKQK